jgi:4-hydroxybenzoate polyprenyltransferase
LARETIKVLPDRTGDLAAGYRTLATRHRDALVLTVFRVSATSFAVGSLATALQVRTAPHAVASICCAVVPTLIVLWHLRGMQTVEEVDREIGRLGYVFALGLVPPVADGLIGDYRVGRWSRCRPDRLAVEAGG